MMKNRKIVYSARNRLLAGIFILTMSIATVIVIPNETQAAVVEDKIIYDDSYDITKLWDETSPKAPVKEGYVFGGWYSEAKEGAYLTSDEAAEAIKAYAKFVPARVLSVKAQNVAGTVESTSTTQVRVISSMDSKDYAKVGFDIWLANRTQLFKDKEAKTPLETDVFYDGLLEGTTKKKANEIFGGVSQYLSVWQLANVQNSNYSKIIYVRPYWITMDGTKVEGLAKYVHIEDEYKDYISVPINILTREQIGVGVMSMSYDQSLTVVGFEAGRLLPNMDFLQNGNSVNMTGYAETVNENEIADGIFANIRFQKPSTTTNFTMNISSFCKWDETPQESVKAWDIRYE